MFYINGILFQVSKGLETEYLQEDDFLREKFLFSYLIVSLNVHCVVASAFSMLCCLSGNHKVVSFRTIYISQNQSNVIITQRKEYLVAASFICSDQNQQLKGSTAS